MVVALGDKFRWCGNWKTYVVEAGEAPCAGLVRLRCGEEVAWAWPGDLTDPKGYWSRVTTSVAVSSEPAWP